jgi:FkbM family methyltransferase
LAHARENTAEKNVPPPSAGEICELRPFRIGKKRSEFQMEWLKSRLRGTAVHKLFATLRKCFSGTLAAGYDLNSTYDRQTVEVMHRVLRKDSNCVDVGAHKGDLLQHMVAIAPAGRHDAFEALPHLASELRKRFPDVRIHELAVSDHSGKADFQYVENAPAYSGLKRRLYDRQDPLIKVIDVRVVSLDEVIPADEAVAFIKIDIEGGEYGAIRGAVKTIGRSRPVIVFEAGRRSTGQYGVTPDQLFDLVTTTLGYELSTMARWLAGHESMTDQEFRDHWEHGPEYYFIATPRAGRFAPNAPAQR